MLVGLIAGLIALGAGPASAAPVTFTQSNYNYPDVSQTADGTLIDVRTAPAGVKYYATLDRLSILMATPVARLSYF